MINVETWYTGDNWYLLVVKFESYNYSVTCMQKPPCPICPYKM